jgi:SAM-dependent methyltransferase
MATAAPYDEIAEWYESVFLARQRALAQPDGFADALGIDQALVELLGRGDGVCLEVGCGTGIYAERVRSLGWEPLGVDLSEGMLRYARERLPVLRGDATTLPCATSSVDAAISVMVHTDLPAYAPVLREIQRVLKPGGVFVHVGVHPCFCGGFADRSDAGQIVIRHGYLDGKWTTDSYTDQGIRDKVGAWHLPLAALLNAMLDAGLHLERMSEGGEPTPIVLSARFRTDPLPAR